MGWYTCIDSFSITGNTEPMTKPIKRTKGISSGKMLGTGETKPYTQRLPIRLIAKLKQIAKRDSITEAQALRDAIESYD